MNALYTLVNRMEVADKQAEEFAAGIAKDDEFLRQILRSAYMSGCMAGWQIADKQEQ